MNTKYTGSSQYLNLPVPHTQSNSKRWQFDGFTMKWPAHIQWSDKRFTHTMSLEAQWLVHCKHVKVFNFFLNCPVCILANATPNITWVDRRTSFAFRTPRKYGPWHSYRGFPPWHTLHTAHIFRTFKTYLDFHQIQRQLTHIYGHKCVLFIHVYFIRQLELYSVERC